MKRLSPLRAWWILLRVHLLHQAQTWRAKLAGGLMLVPIFFSIIALLVPDKTNFTADQHYVVLVQVQFVFFFLWLTPYLYGVSALREEVDNGTLSFLLIRPVPRWVLVLSHFFATNVLVFPFLLASATVCFFIYGASDGQTYLQVVLVLALGTLFYSALFQFIGVLFRQPLQVGIIFGVFWEVSMSRLSTTPMPQVTGLYYLSTLLDFYGPNSGDRELLSSIPDPATSVMILLGATAVFLALACWTIGRIELTPVRR